MNHSWATHASHQPTSEPTRHETSAEGTGRGRNSRIGIAAPATKGAAPATEGTARATEGTARATEGTAELEGAARATRAGATEGTARATEGAARATEGTARATEGTAGLEGAVPPPIGLVTKSLHSALAS